MAGKGFPPAPAAILKLGGNKPKPPPANPAPGAPKCPAWLPKEAKAKWREIVPLLARAKVICLLDRAVLSAYCVAWSEFVEATALLAKDGRTVTCGTGASKPHPAVGMQRSAASMLRLLGASLGLSPEGRLRLRVEAAEGPDALDAFLDRYRTPLADGGT
jgi:P27 family predicted phage terminase small subunit